MKRHLQCAEQQVSPSNLTKYCACHEKWLDCFIVLTYETSFPMRGATGVTSQPHQILRLPRKMTLQDFKENLQKQMKRHFQCGADPSMIRPWSDHENANRNPPRKWGYFSSSPRAFSIEKYNVSRPILHSNLHQILRLPRKVPLELHQILRLSRRKTHILSPHRIWNVIYSARSNRCHHPTSPNTAPATKNDSTALSSSHMKRHFQCAEQQVSPSNLTKYCACHEKWLDCFIVLTYETSFPMRGATGVTIQPHQILRLPRKMTLQDFKENLQKQVKRHFQCGADPTMIRAWSEHDPSMKTQTATRLASEVTFRAHHEHFLLKNTTFRAQSYIQTFTKYCACHVKCHLNFTKYCACHEKWHLNFTKYCACHEKWHLNFTKYCAGHCTVTELYCTLLYLTLLYVTLLYVTLLYVTLLYLTLLYLTLLYLTLLDTTLRDTTLRDTTLLDSTLLDSTLLDSTWHYSTWHYSTWLLFYLTLLYLTCSTWLNFTEMLFVYRKFLNLNFLW